MKATFAIFVVSCVPTALVSSCPGLLVLSLLPGYSKNPCLANGGACKGDMFHLPKLLPSGLALGPLVSGFSVPPEIWRCSLWGVLWGSSSVFLLLFFYIPDTSAQSILLCRVRRHRELGWFPSFDESKRDCPISSNNREINERCLMESNAFSHSRPGYDVSIYASGVFFILQCILLHVPLTYPQYTAMAARAIYLQRPCT